MKRILTLSVAAMALSAVAFAQPQHGLVRVANRGIAPAPAHAQKAVATKMDAASMMKQQQMSLKPEGARVPKTSLESGCYYTKPAGSFYVGWDINGSGYAPTMLNTAAFEEFSFTDKSVPAATSWTINGSDINELVENGVFTYSLEPDYGVPTPVISNGKNTFQLGEANDKNATYPGRVVAWGDNCFTPFDVHTGYYAWGALDNDNLLGSGNYVSGGNLLPAVGVQQTFPKPSSPIYCESAFTMCTSISGECGEITMMIFNDELPADADPVYTLKSANDEQVLLANSTRNGKSIALIMLPFVSLVEDEDGFESQEPFVIDFPYTVLIMWGEDADYNLTALDMQGEDLDDYAFIDEEGAVDYNVAGLLINTGTRIGVLQYQDPLGMNLTFVGVQDNVFVADALQTNDGTSYTNCDHLRISADGKTTVNEGIELTEGWAMVYVAATDLENYELSIDDDAAEWIEIGIDTAGLSTDYSFYITASAKPLPAGVTGRGTEVKIQGRGVAGTLYVAQGDYEFAAINSVNKDIEKEENAIFNLQGQKVEGKLEDLKTGIYVLNGKKVIK